MQKGIIGLFIFSILFLISCDKDDPVPTGQFTVTVENVSTPKMYSSSGVFAIPVGATEPSGIGPGGQYQFTAKAGVGEKLSFATMFVQSNDLFFAPDEAGIPLYDANGNPISGDITDRLQLWDAGTEVNEEPGTGPNQVLRQENPNDGIAEGGNVLPINQVNDGFSYPAVSDVIKVTVTPSGQYLFTVTIENVSTGMTLSTSEGMVAVPLSPGGWVVHSGDAPLFTSGEPARGIGVEEIAEDGNVAPFDSFTSANTGLIYPLSPGVFAVHSDGEPLFSLNSPDFGEGLEAIAEDGSPGEAASSLENKSDVSMSGVFNTPVGSSNPGPLGPGAKYEFTFDAERGDRLSLATMFVQSNDLVYSFESMGIALFDGDIPTNGDKTSELILLDVGTEVNEEPGYGPTQVIRQGTADTGMTENANVQVVSDGFSYPNPASVIRVTISSN